MGKRRLVIDGSRGEGGGQIVRTSVALAAVTGTPLRIENIRAGRQRPGLMRQHLTSVRAASAICGGTLRGDELRSTAIELDPGEVEGGDHAFAVGTAGSVALVVQTVLPAWIGTGSSGTLAVEGGTHAKMAPPIHFLDGAYAHALRAVGHRVEIDLQRHGFYPAGGGKVVVDFAAGDPRPLDWTEPPDFEALEARVLLHAVERDVADRELEVLRRSFEKLGIETTFVVEEVSALSPGNVVHVSLRGPRTTEVFTSFGEVGRRAEAVAEDVVDEVRGFLEADVAVGPHLCDQLIVALSVSAGGRFRTVPLTLHSRTMLEVIPEFVDVEFRVEEEGGTVTVEVLR